MFFFCFSYWLYSWFTLLQRDFNLTVYLAKYLIFAMILSGFLFLIELFMMWRFKPFMPKEQAGLEGRTIDIGSLKVHVRNAIAEGGFSCVYLARDVLHGSKQYALKHIIVNDEESLDLVLKEISVMKSLKGHPNIVTLNAHTFLDMGRTKEALLVMEYCEKSLVSVLENRGAGFFEEKQVLLIFRDVCNAVFAMHCQSPPIAHRDLKAENLLLGADGLWKLCDFGSTSTNHKRFEKPEEMGIEEDIIRKHTTPGYRAPEMWDLYRREIINEKVDIWALGCLLFRICYFKSAFDGESKLQVLNGNYRIPELPKYSTSIVDLIRDMLQSSPDARPDITQVWFRVNGMLPDELQKSLPNRPPEMKQQGIDGQEGFPRTAGKTSPMPRRNPPPPPSAAESNQNVSPASHNSKAGGATGPIGAFWNTQHAATFSGPEETSRPKFDEEIRHNSSSHDKSHPNKVSASYRTSPSKEESLSSHPMQNIMRAKPANRAGEASSKDFEINFFQDDSCQSVGSNISSKLEGSTVTQGEAFNAFVTEFSTNKPTPGNNTKQPEKKELLEAEVEKLNEQLSRANMEKAEITSKFEKLSAICRSQRQEIQELKQALAVSTPSPNRDTARDQASPGSQPSSIPLPRKDNIEGTVWELEQGLFGGSKVSPDSKPWQAFADDDPKQQPTSVNANPRSVRTKNGHQNRQTSETNTSGFGTDSFRAVPASSSQIKATFNESKNYQRFGEPKNVNSKSASQPAGWAGF